MSERMHGVVMHLRDDLANSYEWQCSFCGTAFPAGDEIEEATECPHCNRNIYDWISYDPE